MIPRLLLSIVAALLAAEGYSALTAPPGLVRAAIAKAEADQQRDRPQG